MMMGNLSAAGVGPDSMKVLLRMGERGFQKSEEDCGFSLEVPLPNPNPV